MVIIVRAQFPPEGAAEMGKRLLDQKALPDYIAMKGPFIKASDAVGIQTITIYEFERAKLPDAFELIADRYVSYFGIHGFSYSTNVWLEAGEALKMVGIA